MSYVFVTSQCFGCQRIFSYNPLRVPSYRDINGERQPICFDCVERVNPMRRRNGLRPIVPAPDAYDACDEDELP